VVGRDARRCRCPCVQFRCPGVQVDARDGLPVRGSIPP
jgi:hypothetical protein